MSSRRLAVLANHVNAEGKSEAKPRSQRHFDTIKGGRKRVSDTFADKNTVSCTQRNTALASRTFWRQSTFWHTFGPRLQCDVRDRSGLRG